MAAIYNGFVLDVTAGAQDFQDAALAEFQQIINDPDVEPADVVAAAARLKIDLATAEAMFNAAGKTSDFYRDVVSRAGT